MKKIFDQIDQQLLINHPHLWATKLHSFVFAYMGMIAAALLIGFSYPISTANVPYIENHLVYPFILSGIAFMIWAYKASLFKVTAQFGNTSPFAAFKTQLVYLLIITMLVIVPFIYTSILSFRIKNLATTAELTADCNTLNVGAQYLHLQSNVTFYLYGMYYWNEIEVQKHYASSTSERIAQIKDFIQTANKYGGGISASAEEIVANDDNAQYFPNSYRVNENIYQISKTKASLLFFYQKEAVWLIVSAIFGLLFTLLTYMATSLRTFILSIVVGIIGTIVFGLFSAFAFRGAGNEKGFLLMYIFAVAGLVMIGMAGGNNRFSLAFRPITLSIATVLTPFVPLAMIALSDTHLAKGDDKDFFFLALYVFSVGMTWFLWQFLYLPTLKKIQTIPVDA